MSLSPIHTFKTPPVTETVLGVQFKALPKLTNSLLAVFWNSLGAGWENAEDAPPIELQSERFDAEQEWAQLGNVNLRLTPVWKNRLKITNTKQDRMIQIQNGRFHYNWLKRDGDYPRYGTVRSEFNALFKAFVDFAETKSLGKVEPDQWEVTYVNQLPKGTVWNCPDDWAKLFRFARTEPLNGADLQPEVFSARLAFEIKPKKGRLHTQIQHGFVEQAGGKKELIRVELTARGPIPAGQTFGDGLNLGRKTIVEAFYRMTSKDAHAFWGDRDETPNH